MKYRVVFTTHDTQIESLHGGARLFDLNRTELAIFSFISLMDAFKTANISPDVYIIADRITDRLRNFFISQNVTEIIDVKPHGTFETHGLKPGQFLAWLNTAYEKILTFEPEDIICHVEDDYVFVEEAIVAIDELYKMAGTYLYGFENTDFIIHPSNEPAMYREKSLTGKLDYRLFYSLFRVWVQSDAAHHTLFYKQRLIHDEFMKNAYINEDVHNREPQLWEFSKRNLGLRPIPSLANHMNPFNSDRHLNWGARLDQLYHKYNLGKY